MCDGQNSKLKILIADGSESNRAVLADILGKEYEVAEAKDGEQVMASVRQIEAKPDILLLAAKLPKMDGFEVLNRMEQEGLLSHIPVIITSSDSSLAEIERAYKFGASEAILAPFRAEIVNKRVSDVILLNAREEKPCSPEEQERCRRCPSAQSAVDAPCGRKTPSGGSARLLEQERAKSRFLAALTHEIQFEYEVSSATLTISEVGMEELNLDAVIKDPMYSEKLREVIASGDLEILSDELRSTSPEQPVITYDCKLNCGGEQRWFRILAMALWSDEQSPCLTGFIGKAIDVHESRLKISALEQMASHDSLTGLYNHAYAKVKIKERMSAYPDSQFALAIIDLDYFKSANDEHGHIFGDRVLNHMADMLRQKIRSSDIAVRVGGDEFLIFLEYKMDLEPIIERIFTSLSGTYEDFPISVSMGISKVEGEAVDYEKLFHKADQALYTAKQAGRGQYRFYDDSMEQMLSAISTIESERG